MTLVDVTGRYLMSSKRTRPPHPYHRRNRRISQARVHPRSHSDRHQVARTAFNYKAINASVYDFNWSKE